MINTIINHFYGLAPCTNLCLVRTIECLAKAVEESHHQGQPDGFPDSGHTTIGVVYACCVCVCVCVCVWGASACVPVRAPRSHSPTAATESAVVKWRWVRAASDREAFSARTASQFRMVRVLDDGNQLLGFTCCCNSATLL